MHNMTIGKLAKACDVKVDTIRYYERTGLLKPPARTAAGYRTYGTDTLRRLQFIRRAQNLGFSLKEIDGLISLQHDGAGETGDVLALTREKIAVLEQKIQELRALQEALGDLAAICPGEGPLSECPILDYLDTGQTHG